MLIDPITNLVTASEKIASGDFEIGVPYESEDELGRLSDSFETAAAILKKVVSDLQTIVEQFPMVILMFTAAARKHMSDSSEMF